MPSNRAGFHVRFEPALLARLDRQAERRVLSRSKLIEIAVVRLLGELEDPMDELDNYLEDN